MLKTFSLHDFLLKAGGFGKVLKGDRPKRNSPLCHLVVPHISIKYKTKFVKDKVSPASRRACKGGCQILSGFNQLIFKGYPAALQKAALEQRPFDGQPAAVSRQALSFGRQSQATGW